MAQMVKHLPTMQETWVQPLGWEDVLEKEMATHCSILAWYGPWGRKESDTTEQLHFSLSFFQFPGALAVRNLSEMQETQEIWV